LYRRHLAHYYFPELLSHLKNDLTMIKLLLITGLSLLFSFNQQPHDIVGKWMVPNAADVYVNFNSDKTFKVTVGTATENEGKYAFKDDVVTMWDKNCGEAMPGAYQLQFHTSDSASFKVISDSCDQRRGEVDGGMIVRMK
jgi:hypothetical protein